MSSLQRGEIRWYKFPRPDKQRPVLVLTRDAVVNSLNEVMVVAITTSIREISTHVVLTTDEGMPQRCAINLDQVAFVPRSNIGTLITTLDDARWSEVEHALLVATGFA